jgi:photosystem II stability/assembly factor-like uncharacterized protein
VSDVDFAVDTTLGAASTLGVRIGTSAILGAVFSSADGGTTWQEIAGSRAPDSVLTYHGVAVKANGDIFVVGGNGYVARLSPTGGGNFTRTEIALPLTSPNTADPFAFLLNDVQFAPENDQLGWIVGAIQSGVVNGVPRYAGVIFTTRDGGSNWIRQGIRGATNYGAEFPALNRLDVRSSTSAWAVGDAGLVIRFTGPVTQ